MVRTDLVATCDPELWTNLDPGERMLMELKAMTDPVYFWLHPKMGNYPIWESKQKILTQLYTYKDGRRQYNELVFPAGMRSGKTMTAAFINLTETYKLLMLKDPQKFYNLGPNTEIGTANVANSREQAKDTVFKKVEEIICNSPYFMAQKPDHTAFQIKFPKNITTKALGSNLGSAVGRTLKCFVADEIADYDDPEDTYQKLSKSTGNFAKWNENIKVMIGSPDLEGDYFMTYYHRAVDEKWENTLALWLPTWELNPEMDKKTLEIERMKDPARFDRDYGAQPMSIRESLFNPELLKLAADKNKLIRNLFVGMPNKDSREGFMPELDYTMLQAPPDAMDFMIMVDPSVKHDAFGLSVGYKSVNNEAKCIGSTILKAPKNEELHTEDIAELLKPIMESLDPRYYIYDVHLHSDLQLLAQRHGVAPYFHQLDLNDWMFTRNDLYNHILSVPYSDYLWTEFRQLLVVNGKKVDHPRSGSKDQADSVAQFSSFLRRLEEEERLKSDATVSHYIAGF